MSTVSISATPFPYPFAPGKTALVVIDMQRDFVEVGGRPASDRRAHGRRASRCVAAGGVTDALVGGGWTMRANSYRQGAKFAKDAKEEKVRMNFFSLASFAPWR